MITAVDSSVLLDVLIDDPDHGSGSLEALQKAALGEGDEGIQEWLESTGLDENRKVAQALDVDNRRVIHEDDRMRIPH